MSSDPYARFKTKHSSHYRYQPGDLIQRVKDSRSLVIMGHVNVLDDRNWVKGYLYKEVPSPTKDLFANTKMAIESPAYIKLENPT